ncbi:MAG TPA: hypothetical protein VFE47_25200 [Tepidisphaeraceae bacterium]|nr:hypothetical protein [Tepidisphaeraceae bacterium]
MPPSNDGPTRLPPPLPLPLPLPYASANWRALREPQPIRFALVGWIAIVWGIFALLANFVAIWLYCGWMIPAVVSPVTNRAASAPSAPAATWSPPSPIVPPVITHPAPPSPPAIAVAPFAGDLYSPHGLSQAERQRVLKFVDEHSRIQPRGRSALEAMLCEYGRDLFSPTDGEISEEQTRSQLRIERDLPKTARGWPQIEPWPIEIAGPGGEIDVQKQTAIFKPGSGAAQSSILAQGTQFIDEHGKQVWSYFAIVMYANEIIRLSNGRATPVQLGAFAADRRNTPVTSDPMDTIGAYGGILSDGTLLVQPSYGKNILIDTLGNVSHTTGAVTDPQPRPPVSPAGGFAAGASSSGGLPTSTSPPAPATPPARALKLQLTRGWVWVLVIEAIISAIASIALMVAGQQLTQKRVAARLWARGYATVQLPLNVFGMVVGIMLGDAMYARMGLPPQDPSSLVVSNVVGMVLLSILPIVLLWVISGPIALKSLGNPGREKRDDYFDR